MRARLVTEKREKRRIRVRAKRRSIRESEKGKEGREKFIRKGRKAKGTWARDSGLGKYVRGLF